MELKSLVNVNFPSWSWSMIEVWNRSDQETIPDNGRIERNSNPIVEEIKSSKDCVRANFRVYFLLINKYM